MTPEFAVQLIRDAMIMMFWLSAPFLLIAFATGILISAMPWVLQKAMTYATSILGNLSRYAN
jgi:flagellar biosynthesis protein FliQ